jgi:hypothetical protein
MVTLVILTRAIATDTSPAMMNIARVPAVGGVHVDGDDPGPGSLRGLTSVDQA